MDCSVADKQIAFRVKIEMPTAKSTNEIAHHVVKNALSAPAPKDTRKTLGIYAVNEHCVMNCWYLHNANP